MYLEAKYHYGLGFNKIKEDSWNIDDWFAILDRVEVEFGRVAAGSLELLSEYDPEYQAKMIKVLTSNVCSFTKSLLPEIYH